MSTSTENTLETNGTNSLENGLSIEEAEKVFAEAYTKTAPSTTSTTIVPETPVPQVEKKEETVAEVSTKSTSESTEVKKEEEPKSVTQEESTNKDPYAWLEKISDQDLRSKVLTEIQARADAEHRFKSANGRVNALRQEQLVLHKKLAERAGPQTVAPTAAQAASLNTPKTLKEWETLIENDPELAKAVEARLDSRVSELEQRIEQKFGTLKESAIDPLYEHQSKQYLEREAEMLAQAVPNYVEVINSPEWRAWLDDKPEEIRRAITSSTNHQDALKAFSWFADDMVRVGWDKNSPFRQQQQVQQSHQAQNAPAKTVAPSEQAEKIAKEREDKLKATAVVSAAVPTPVATKAPAGTGAFSMEEAEKLFNEAYNKFRPGAQR